MSRTCRWTKRCCRTRFQIEATQRHWFERVVETLKPACRRQVVDEVRASWKVSIRRACSALKVGRSLSTYKSQRGDQADLKTRISEITRRRVRYGYPSAGRRLLAIAERRRVHVLMRREGWAVNPKRIHRLYKEMGLQLRNKVSKRRVKAKRRDDRTVATRVNQTW